MNQLDDMDEAVRRIKAAGPNRKDRVVALNDYLRGEPYLGTAKKPNKSGWTLLHRRALLVTRLRVEGILA